ncbi:hypothetical protein [Emticicia sp. C21]|uniref:hypothetical protein n=1 Tax=Emticicia sp. C21 TaxID=2302915 RepID=UPI000E35126F|nr:hypothetical protein [Emticicia sp. C21]RFS13685.1 hypothetical protein D0T08_25200 [Emticicia sp. C21]
MLTDEQIFDILDGCADAEILQKHTHLLAGSVVYQQYFNELAAIHFDLADMPLEKTSADFTANILAALPSEKPVFVIAKKKKWSAKFMYGFFGTMIGVLITTILVAIFYLPSSETTIEQPNQVVEVFNDFIRSYFTQIAILLNLMVLLALFDRKVLRPYFKQRSMRLG